MLKTRSFYLERASDSNNTDMYYAYDIGNVRLARGKWGYINKQGEMEIEAIYDNSQSFSEGLAAVKVGGKYGFINPCGKMVIEPSFEGFPSSIGSFYGFLRGLAAVKTSEGYLYINKKGENAFGMIFSSISPFFDDVAIVIYDGKWAFIDLQGSFTHVFYDTRVRRVKRMSEGLAGIKIRDDQFLYGFVDKKGVIRIEPKYIGVYHFRDGLCLVMVSQEELFFIDKQGEVVIAGLDDLRKTFSNGMNIVRFTYLYDGLRVLVDTDGNRIGEGTYETDDPFSCGLKAERSKDPDISGYGYINKLLEWVIEPQFYRAYPFVNVFVRNMD